ncbi:MAG: hypothetical protein MJ252_10815 [archaeon]|nr:hypothetical protein [archaeon]
MNPDEVSFNVKEFSSQSLISNDNLKSSKENLRSLSKYKKNPEDKSNDNKSPEVKESMSIINSVNGENIKEEKTNREFPSHSIHSALSLRSNHSRRTVRFLDNIEETFNSKKDIKEEDIDYISESINDDNNLDEDIVEEEETFTEINGGKPESLTDVMKIEDPFYNIDLIDSKNSRYQRNSNFRTNFMRDSTTLKGSSFLNHPEKTNKDKSFLKDEFDSGGTKNQNESPPITEKNENNFEPKNEGILNSIAANKGYSFISSIFSNDVPVIKNVLSLSYFNSPLFSILQCINFTIKYTLIQTSLTFKILGIIGAPMAIVCVSLISFYSVYLLVKVKKFTNLRNYMNMAEKTFGLPGKLIMLIINFLTAYGHCLCYIIIFFKTVPRIVTVSIGSDFKGKQLSIVIVLGISLLFISHKKDLSGMKYLAYYGILGILGFLTVTIGDIIYVAHNGDKIIDTEIKYLLGFYSLEKTTGSQFIKDILTVICCLILSFNFHMYTLSFYDSMDGKKNNKLFFVITSISLFISTFIYLICGVIGYLVYSDTLLDSMLDAPGRSTTSNLLGMASLVYVSTLFPLTFNTLKHYFCFLLDILLKIFRRIINKIYTKHKKQKFFRDKDTSFHSGYLKSLNGFTEFISVILLILSLFFIADKKPSIMTICSLLGGTVANLVSIIFPCIFFIFFSDQKCLSTKNFFPIALLLVGLLIFTARVSYFIIHDLEVFKIDSD